MYALKGEQTHTYWRRATRRRFQQPASHRDTLHYTANPPPPPSINKAPKQHLAPLSVKYQQGP